jgi:predicted enzyme related to lactoylglutathione lyase
MATVHEYSLGTPCWFELATTDQAAAKDFYSRIFGWHANDNPMGPGEFYTMFELEGRSAGAAYTLPPKLVAAGVGAHWNVYFATPDVDASATKVAELGGTVIQPPFEVMDVGRMSNCKDPGGAPFSLWQARRHAGAGVLNENGAVLWTELATRDTEQAREFYTGLLGWETKGSAVMATYIEFSTDGRARGGLLPMGDEWGAAESRWGVYFMVADCDAAVAQARELGATICFGPISAPGVGRFAALTDPQGASFSVITPQPA